MCQSEASYKNIFMRTQLDAEPETPFYQKNYAITNVRRVLSIQGLSFNLTFHLYLRFPNIQSKIVGSKLNHPKNSAFAFIDN